MAITTTKKAVPRNRPSSPVLSDLQGGVQTMPRGPESMLTRARNALLGALSISLVLSAKCSIAATAVGVSVPYLAIEGTVRMDVSQDVISLSYDDRMNRLEVTLNNLSDGHFKYSTSPLLVPGTQVAMYVDAGGTSIKMFDGTISTFAPGFDSATTPTLTLVATRKRPAITHSQVSATFGAELLEFYPVLNAKGNIKSTGVTDGNPYLKNGTTLAVNGVGQPFVRSYSVSSTIHLFDLTHGYRTRFIASGNAAPLP